MITTHVLDTSAGGPAAGMSVILAIHRGADWVPIAAGHTDANGRLTTLTDDMVMGPGVYRLTFDTGSYHQAIDSFFPEVHVIFKVKAAGDHVHVPLLLSPFGYSTYRGT